MLSTATVLFLREQTSAHTEAVRLSVRTPAVTRLTGVLLLSTLLLSCTGATSGTSGSIVTESDPYFHSEEIFEPIDLHVHGSSIVELPNGDLLSVWFEGSGERWADDVALRGARFNRDGGSWGDTFLMADTPGFPDINPVLYVDGQERLWLFWYTVLANLWETSLPKYRVSTDYMMKEGPPEWTWQDVIHVKPGGPTERGIQPDDPFVETVRRKAEEYEAYMEESGLYEQAVEAVQAAGRAGEGDVIYGSREWWAERSDQLVWIAEGREVVRDGRLYHEDGSYTSAETGYPLMRRIGWQTYNKPVELADGRMVLPLYSDAFSTSLMAITDDGARSWTFSEPLIGGLNIQATLAEKRNGDLVAYMRDNGPPPKRMHMSTSPDRGESWSTVNDSELLNPGSGTDMVVLQSGEWVMIYNNLESGRHSLAASLSDDEGESWRWTRIIDSDMGENPTTSHYPAVTQGSDGLIHVAYSHHYGVKEGRHRTIKWAVFNTDWIKEGGMESVSVTAHSRSPGVVGGEH